MGVDFYSCSYCNSTFPDCGPFIRCKCGRKWHSPEYSDCAKKDGYRSESLEHEEDDDYDEENWKSCFYCRDEKATDSELLQFILDSNNATREEAEEVYLTWKRHSND